MNFFLSLQSPLSFLCFQTLEFLRSKEDFIGQLLHHLGTSAIMDLLLRLITCIESPELRMDAISVSLSALLLYNLTIGVMGKVFNQNQPKIHEGIWSIPCSLNDKLL